MGKLIDILKITNLKDQSKKLSDYRQKINQGIEGIPDKEDMRYAIRNASLIHDATIWNELCGIFIMSGKNDLLIEYCENILLSKSQTAETKRYNYMAQYLFLYASEKRELLLNKYLHAKNISIQFAMAEEYAKTNLPEALKVMLDIYERVFFTFDHDIAEAIELWVCNEGDHKIIMELEKRINNSSNNRLANNYKNWTKQISKRIKQ